MPDNIKPQAGPLTPEQQLFKSIADKQLVDLKLDKAKPVVPQPKATEYKQPTNINPSEVKDANGDSYTDEGLVNLVQSLHGDKSTAFHATAGSFDYYNSAPQVTDYGKYGLDKDISISSNTTQEQLDMMRADEQSFGAEAANTIMGAIVKAPIKLASSFSSFLVDTDSYSKLNDSMWNQVMKNSTETLNQMDEKVGDVFKIHGADDQADGTFGNREWWMKNAFQEGGAYLLGFMAAGAGTSALMARVAQGSSAVFAGLATRVYNAASVGGKIEKAAVAARAMLPSIRSGLQGVGDLASAYMLSDLEAGAEALSVADEVYKEKYSEFLKKGGFDPNGVVPISVQEEADKYAGQIAANAGDVTRSIGRMTMVFNMTGLKYFTGSKLSTTKYVKHTALTALKDVGLEIPQEMGEELLMGVGGALARRQASENLTAENGGGFLSHSHLVSDTWNHVFSQQGAEEAVLGGVLGGLFGAIGEGVKAKSGANKSNNDLADFQASNTTEAGYLKQLLDPKSQIAQSIMNLKSLSDTQSDLFPKITEAHLKGDEVSANNMRAQLLQFQAYDYFQKGMGDQLNATMEALTSDKQLAEETFGPDYHEKLTEAKKIIKEAQGVYDTEVPFATPGTEKMLYHNILNRNNISKAIHDVRIDLSKHRQQYIQDLANYTAEDLGVPSMEGLNYDVSKQEEEFKKSNPLSLQKVTENETKLAELQSQFKQNQAQHNLIRKGKYTEFETAAKVKGTSDYTAPIVKQEAKLTKEQEIANNTKAQEAQSLANDIQDESKPEVTKDTVNQRLDEKIAEIDTQVANEEITPEEAEAEKAKIQEVKAEVETKTTPVVEEVTTEETPSKFEDAESVELTEGFDFSDVSDAPLLEPLATAEETVDNENGVLGDNEPMIEVPEGSTTEEVSDIEAKKADVEFRRRKALRALETQFILDSNEVEKEFAKKYSRLTVMANPSKYNKIYEDMGKDINDKFDKDREAINAKYDAELAALDQPQVSKPTKKLVYVPTSISVKTVSSKDNAITTEASNEGGEGGADIDKVQASNVLDNSENSIQVGTNLLITPTVVVGKNAYQFTTEDGRLVGYLHEPTYVRESRVAVDKLEDAEAEILRQKEELTQMWANLDTHFSATSEPYKTVVTTKTPGTINTTKSDNKVKPEILADSRVVVIPIIADSSQPGKNKLNLAGQEINEYLEKIGGILDDASYEQLTESKNAEGNHVILVPTATRLGGKVVYNYSFADRTVLSDNPEVKALVQRVVSNYLKGESSSTDQGFVEDILTKDIEFGTFPDSRPKVKIKKDNALVTLDNMGVLDNISIRMPLSYKHDQTVTIAGQEFIPQQFIGGTLKSNLNYSTLQDGTKSYVMNPVISFEPIVSSSNVVPDVEEAVKGEPELDLDFDIMNSPKDTEENPLLSLDRLSTEGGFNIIKKQEIVKAISVQMFYQISKKTEGESVSDALAKVKAGLTKMKAAYDYVVKNGLNEKLVAAGFTDNAELNEEFSANLGYTLENWDTLSDNALNLLKETGYNLKKDTRDLSTAEIKPNPEEISDTSIQNDTADTVDSNLVDKPEEASSSKYDKMMFEESMYEVSSAFVRTWLNSIGSGKKSVIGGVDSYGGKKLFGELLNLFKDRVYNEEDFKAIITKEGVSKPQFADLAKKFDTLDPHYKVQILNSLDVTKANFRAVNPKGVFDSNRNTKEIQLKEMVNQGLQALFNEGIGGQPNTLSGYGQAYMTKLNALLENTGKADVLADVEVISILGDLGVPVTKEVLARLKADKKAFGRTLLEGIQNSIEAGQKAQTLEEVKMQDKLYYVLVGAPANTTKINLQEYIIESDGDSIVTVEGKKVYPFGIHHATSKLWANLKDRVKGPGLIANLKSVPFISENTWLASEKFGQIIYMDGAAVKEGSKAKTYADMTTNEKLMAKFEFFTRSTTSNGTYSYWSSAKSDKSVVLGIEAPKITSGFELAVSKVIAAEAKRINQFAKLPKEKGVNGSVFYLFPWLNDMSELFLETVNGKEVDEKFLQPSYSKLQGYARKVINAEKDAFIKEYLKSGAKLTDDVKKQIEAFVTSELVNNYNFLSLVSGDPAYFAKLNKDGSVNIPKTMANLFKRLTRDIATAKRGRGVYKELKVITFKEPGGDNLISKNYAQMEAILGEQASGYKNVQAADAQGYCTIKEYWDLMYGDGLISLERRDALCKQFDDHFASQGTVEGLIYTEADLEGILLKPRKPVTIGNKFSKIGDSSVNRPIYIKYSIFPLLPQLLASDSPLIKLCDFMENNGVHRAVAESGFKVGSAKPVNIEAETITATEDQFTVVDREMDGNQLDIPYDETKEAILQGTQLLKLVFDGVEDSDLKEVFYKNQERLLDKMDADYKAKMGIGEVDGKFQIVDMGKFKKELAVALSDSFENPNDKVSFETVGDKFKLPLFFNKLGPKIESTLIQGFKKKVLKSKLGGRSFVLVSEYLFKGNTGVIATTPSYDPEKGLLPARLMKGGRLATAEEITAHYENPTENPLTVAPAQVMIAWNFKDENGNLLKMSDYVKDGKLDMTKIDPEMLKMVGYRIPTQGHNSMSVCEVVGFLPAYMGDSIVASKDWTVQMGSDFDIDKVFMHFKYSTVKDGKIVADSKEGSEKALKNEIIDNYMSVLSKTEVFKKMMIPLDFGSLPDIVKELQKIDRFKESQGSILSPVTQVNNYETGTAGKVGVGMSSLLSVFASIIQGKGLSVREGLSIKVGDRIIDLSDLSSPNQLLDPTKSKNMVISAFQSASVDNIKELLVKTINYNSETHPLLISMSLLGLDEEWISYMMVQEPESLQPFYEAIKGFEPQPLTLELLKQGVTNPDSLTPYEKANLYHHYDSFKLLGDEISKVSGLVNITTNGFGTYFEDINYLQESSNILEFSRALNQEGMNNLVKDPFWGKGFTFMGQTQEIIGQLFPVTSSLYKSVVAYGNDLIKYPTKEYKKALKNFVKAYMMSDLSMFGGSVTEQRQRLFYGDNSLAHRASVLKADNPKNSFLQSLSFSFSNDGIKPHLVKYIGKGLTVTEKFLWQQQLKEMFYSENPIEAEFAKDFIIYQYAAGGIQVPTSAISMLPSDLTRLMKLDEDVSKIDWSVASLDVVNDILTQFKQSNKDKYKFIEQPNKSQGFFGMMTVVKNVEPSVIEEIVVNEVKTLNEALAEQVEGKFKGIIEDLGQLEPTTVEYVDSAEIDDNAGEYDRGTGVIKIATDISKDKQAETLIHETLHHVLSATTKAYEEYKATGNPGKLTQEGITAMRRMERVYTVAKENFVKKGGPKRLENTLLNLDEFMSDMVSEKTVQKWANEIEVSGESLWSKFKKLAANILQSLGLVKLKEGSLLEAFLDTYLEVKENRVVGNGEGKLNSPKKTSKYNKTTVLAKVGKMGQERKQAFLQNMSESTKLNPLDVSYLNITDFDNYYFTTYKGRVDNKIVSKVSVDKMGEYFTAKEKQDREISYTQKNISEIIKDVANSDRPLAGLAKHLVKYVDLVKPKIEFSTDLRLPNHATESGFGDKAEGLYNNRTNVISINLGVNHHKGLEHTILHEYMHALTAHEIRRGGPKVDALKDLYNKAKDSLKDKDLHPNTKYALLDWDEFIVGIFTNGMFIKELQSLPATGVKYKNLWENVLDSLLNILGITKKDSFYEEAFALATNIVEDHISYAEMMERQEEFSNFVEYQFEDSQFSAGDTMQSIEDFFNNCK